MGALNAARGTLEGGWVGRVLWSSRHSSGRTVCAARGRLLPLVAVWRTRPADSRKQSPKKKMHSATKTCGGRSSLRDNSAVQHRQRLSVPRCERSALKGVQNCTVSATAACGTTPPLSTDIVFRAQVQQWSNMQWETEHLQAQAKTQARAGHVRQTTTTRPSTNSMSGPCTTKSKHAALYNANAN